MTTISASAARHVRLNYHPTTDGVNADVARIKARAAELITECEQLRDAGRGPREAALAITKLQEATYFAVMAITAPKD